MAIDALSETATSDDLWLWNINGGKFGEINDPVFRTNLCRFCEALPLYLEDEWVFVHAGAYPNIDLGLQSERVLLWDRTENNFGYFGKRLIVGHTPNQTIQKSQNIVYVDTGAFYYGRLSAYDARNDVEFFAQACPCLRLIQRIMTTLC